MKQFITSNIWSRGMMPATFFKEQVFNMCEKLADACVWNEIIVRFHERYNGEDQIYRSTEKILDKMYPIVIEVCEETNELDERNQELIIHIISIAIDNIKNIPSSTSKILHKLYPIKFYWKLWDLDKLTAYYQIVFDSLKDFKLILGDDLNYHLIRNGINQIISNMKDSHRNDTIGNKKNLDYVVLLYPLGLADGRICYNTEPEKDYLFWAMERIHPDVYKRNHISESTFSYSNLALEILVESFFDSGNYQYENGSIILNEKNDEQETVAEDILNYFYDTSVYFDEEFDDSEISGEKFPLGENTIKELDRIDKTFDVIKKNVKELWSIDIQKEVSNYRKDALVMLYILHKYSHFITCTTEKKVKRNIFHVLKHPSYENSLTGFLDNSTKNADILFSLKNDLLRYTLDTGECKDTIFKIEEIVSRVYLDFNARIEEIKDTFFIEGLGVDSFHDIDNIIYSTLTDKENILRYIQREFHDMYKGTVSFPRESNLLTYIYLKVCESEYDGILRDMELLYSNMENWIIKLPDSATQLLLTRQCEIEQEEHDDFEFVDFLKKHSSMVAKITDPDTVEKATKDIRRYADRSFCIWQAVLDWYPLSDWGKKNSTYADFGTMTALVQLERQLRKGRIKLKYLSAYKGDSGKELTVRFREDLPKDKIAVEIIMNLLFFQILSNFGLHKSIKTSLSIMLLYIAQYRNILKSNSVTELNEQREEYAQDARLPQEKSTHRNIYRAKNIAKELYQEAIKKN